MYYLSFGQGHRHEVGDREFDKDCLASIPRETEPEAREFAVKLFGDKWSHLYDKPDLQFFPRGVIPLNEDDEPAMKHAEDPSWTIKCYVDCPYCGAFLDLMDQKDSGLDWESQPHPHEDTTDLDLHVECGECKKEFIVDAITY